MKTVELISYKVVGQHNILYKLYSRPYVFSSFRHLGRHLELLERHLELLETLNDDKLSSSRILNGNALHTRIHQEKTTLYQTSRSIEYMPHLCRTNSVIFRKQCDRNLFIFYLFIYII